MTVQEVMEIRETLAKIAEELPFRTALKIAKFCKATEEISGEYAKERDATIMRYVTTAPDGTLSLPEELVAEAQDKVAELEARPYDGPLPAFAPEELDSVSLTPREAYVLLPLME